MSPRAPLQRKVLLIALCARDVAPGHSSDSVGISLKFRIVLAEVLLTALGPRARRQARLLRFHVDGGSPQILEQASFGERPREDAQRSDQFFDDGCCYQECCRRLRS